MKEIKYHVHVKDMESYTQGTSAIYLLFLSVSGQQKHTTESETSVCSATQRKSILLPSASASK
jgi:hypothetical protein